MLGKTTINKTAGYVPLPSIAPAPPRPRPVQPAEESSFPADGSQEGFEDAVSHENGLPHGDQFDDRERLVQAMETAGWVQAKAARILGLTPRQMGYALRKHQIDIKKF
jgi:Nif-specific regulatory protein